MNYVGMYNMYELRTHPPMTSLVHAGTRYKYQSSLPRTHTPRSACPISILNEHLWSSDYYYVNTEVMCK